MALILVGCEESQAITIAFRKLGHEAFSCAHVQAVIPNGISREMFLTQLQAEIGTWLSFILLVPS